MADAPGPEFLGAVKSSSFSSCMAAIALLPLLRLPEKLGERGGMFPSSLKGLRVRAGLLMGLCGGTGDSEPD
jgi:hypothetical protein